jgi:hypothetical protein
LFDYGTKVVIYFKKQMKKGVKSGRGGIRTHKEEVRNYMLLNTKPYSTIATFLAARPFIKAKLPKHI